MPKSHRNGRVGADAAFAKAMARSEFGRFYCDERDMQEVRRSMARSPRRGRPSDVEPTEATPRGEQPRCAGPKSAKTKAAATRPTPRARERRTELAEALAKLRETAKPR